MHNNKILYRPRTADPSTLTTDNLLTLANIITTSGLDHHCPPSLGVLTSVHHHPLPARKHKATGISQYFGTSQPTISRAINTVLNILNVVLPPPPQPGDLNPNKLYVLDGTLIPCWWWKTLEASIAGNTTEQGITYKF